MLTLLILAAESPTDSSPPLGIPTVFWPAIALAFAVGFLFVKEIVVPGQRALRAEKRAEIAERANRESVNALKEAVEKLVEKRR